MIEGCATLKDVRMEDNITRLLVHKKGGYKCIRKRIQVVEINFSA